MKRILIIILAVGAFALTTRAADEEQLRSGLIGHTMGGRERSWKFQSPDQIKELWIKGKTERAQGCVYTVSLLLQCTDTGCKYVAEARVECAKADTGWKVKQVGLLSLAKVK
jgi:hypothetical protein